MSEFNPTDHNVDDVNAHLATADEAERERVLAIENGPDGKGRSTVKAPEAKPEDGTTPGLDTGKADTFDQAAAKATEPEGEAYAKGYIGHVPSRDGDNPVDLTLAGVTGQNKDA